MARRNLIGLIVPTMNAGNGWEGWIESLKSQSLKPDRVLVVDSSSEDQTARLAKSARFEVLVIPRSDFNHGATRQLAAEVLADTDIFIYLTQDALLADPDALQNLVGHFVNESVGAVYGRQLPHPNAKPFGSHARLFNYPETSQVRSMADASRLGIKTAFISNSFAAYRRSAFMAVGGFPSNTILSEDTYVSAKLLLGGWKIVYCAEAQVFHSHDYSLIQEFKRYFDIGVFHAREYWVRAEFGGAEGEGKKFVLSEVRYLMWHAPWLIPSAILRTFSKYAGYQLGLHENHMPVALKRHLSMHKGFWSKESVPEQNI
ncbi:MAG: glycosyltransferase family 2 protein [Burkholderiales bacterium]|jgi:rhamnosyltransferase